MRLFKPKPLLPLHHPYYFLVIFLILMTLSYLYADRPVSEWILTAPHVLTSICQAINTLLAPEVCIFALPLLFYIFRAWLEKDSLANLFLLMGISVNASQVLITPIKMFFGRYRPDLWLTQHLYGFDFWAHTDKEMSFPSGHAGAIASILFSIACVYPKKFSWLLVLTFILSFCRVVVEKHYMSDILASILLAFFVSQWIYLSLKKAKMSF